MKAAIYKAYGGPEVVTLAERPKPQAGAGEVLIKCVATTVSSGDWRARSLILPKGFGLIGRLMFGIKGPRKQVLGTDVAGIIQAVGAGVTEYRPGDAVIAFPGGGFGAHAEYIVMKATGPIVAKPASLSFAEAAALPFGGTTAYDFLVNKAQLKPGARVLVNGATGATGSAAVQIAKALGAEVTAVCSTASMVLARALGADHVIDYTAEDFSTGGARFEMIVDTAATATWPRANAALVPGGQLVVINGSAGTMLLTPLRARLAGKHAIVGVASEAREVLEAVVALAAQGAFTPHIGQVFPFEEIAQAHAAVETGHKKGSVVVAITNDQTATDVA